jgi:hypothetical protein
VKRANPGRAANLGALSTESVLKRNKFAQRDRSTDVPDSSYEA